MPDPFIWSAYRIYPNVERRFSAERKEFALFFEVYNMGVDQAAQKPELEFRFLLHEQGTSLPIAPIHLSQKFLGDRVCVLATLPTAGLAPGAYLLVAEISDRSLNRKTEVSETFEIR